MSSAAPESVASDRAVTTRTASRPFLITFSGIDGAGKSTQIECLQSRLQQQGLRVLRLSFWDDIAVWSKMRAGVGNWSLHSNPSIPENEPGAFKPQNNKHVRKWYLTTARSAFYLLDVARLHRVIVAKKIKDADVVIFDRYIYDQIANFSSQSFARIYGKLLCHVAPAPDLAFVVDASPAAAFARKPEYPLEFVCKNRQNFLRLRELVPQLIVIAEAKPEDVSSEIFFHIIRSRLSESASLEVKLQPASGKPLAPPRTSCRCANQPN
jgi:thymidylate kinase